MKYYRLPDGLTVTNTDTYLNEWNKLIKPFEKLLGVRVTAFDPDISYIDAHSPNSWSGTNIIPVYLVKRVLEGISNPKAPNRKSKPATTTIKKKRSIKK